MSNQTNDFVETPRTPFVGNLSFANIAEIEERFSEYTGFLFKNLGADARGKLLVA